jgi:insulysin
VDSDGAWERSDDPGQTGESVEPVPITDKPLGDYRKYQGAILANGLRVVNIQDEKSLDSAMAMGVLSGYYNDPPDIPGIAHFCEHMLFLGSKKFPHADEFDNFLNKNGGQSNAFTSGEITDFFLQASSSSALEALPRFADWFSEPSFNRSYVEKEVHAIDSEHSKNVQDPMWRVIDTINSLANPENPLSRFHTGNLDTLMKEPKERGIDTVAVLKTYFKEHYCPSKMRLVTYGPAPLSEQFAAAQAAFSGISPGNESCRRNISWAKPPAWPAERLGRWVNILGTQPQPQLWLMFPLPDLSHAYASLPQKYLGYVFMYSGVNSLSRVLDHSLNLVSNLDYQWDPDSAGTRFMLVLTLTSSGQAQRGLVLDIVFSYIAALRHAGASKPLYDSLKDLSKLNWDWAGYPNPMSAVESFSQAMKDMPLPDVIWGGARIDVVNVTLINSLLEKLRPDNMLAVSVSLENVSTLFHNQTINTLPHYGVQYSVQSIENVLPGYSAKWQNWISDGTSASKIGFDINTSLSACGMKSLTQLPVLPGPIIGVPKHIPLDNMHAKLDAQSSNSLTGSIFGPIPDRLVLGLPQAREIWYRSGWMTNSPQVQVSTIVRPLQQENDPEPSAEESVRFSLYASLLMKDLQPRLVDLTATGVSYTIMTSSEGLGFDFGGFAPNIKMLIQKVLEGYTNFSKSGSELTSAADFQRTKDDLRQRLQTYSDMPSTYAVSDRNMLLDTSTHSEKELLAILNNVSLASVQDAIKRSILSKPLRLTALAMGNLNQSTAVDVIDAIQLGVPGVSAGLAGKNDSGHIQRVSKVVRPSVPIELRKLNPRQGDPNDVVVVSVLRGVSTVKSRVHFGIIGTLLGTVAYEELRTQRQLGYVVNAGTIQLSNVLGVSSVVQGTKLRADQAEAAVEAVYHKFMWEKLSNLTDDDFKSFVASYRSGLLVPTRGYSEEFRNFWSPIKGADSDACLHLQDDMLRYLDNSLTSKQPLIDEWTELMTPSTGTRQKVVVKYFAGEVPARPTIAEAKAAWAEQGVPAHSQPLLQREYDVAMLVDSADSATRAKMLASGDHYPTDMHCKLEEPATMGGKPSAVRIGLAGV